MSGGSSKYAGHRPDEVWILAGALSLVIPMMLIGSQVLGEWEDPTQRS